MDITSVTVPNLVVSDIFLTKPMSSFTGYITYMQFALGTPKGGVGGRDADGNLNTVVANPFMYGASTEERERYTSDRVVETLASFTSGTTKVTWTPVNTAAGYILKDASDNVVEGTIAADGTITSTSAVKKVAYVYDNVVVPQKSLPTLVGEMKGITLEAKARRIAIQYSQIAAFQA